MTSALTDSTIFSNSWQNFFDLIETITDPSGRVVGTKWIYSAFPIARFAEESAYPLVVVKPIDINREDFLTVGTSKQNNITLSITFDIYTLKAIDLDSISDGIFDKIETSLSTLQSNKIFNPRISRTAYNHFERSGMKVHFKSIVYQFEFDYS